MRCSVPFCRNSTATDNASVSEGKGAITFYRFPSEVHLRAAWLGALGNQDIIDLQNSAVVCSQHFLDDEMYKTDSGLMQILPGAIPSTMQVCMICLDTDRKLVLMSKHKLEDVYEKLTGHPLFDLGNLKQTVCILCAQRLRNFKTFRAKSLRARSLMMDLVEKYVLITNEHVKKINSVKNQLKYNFVQKTLGPDHCDSYIVEPDETEQIKREEAFGRDDQIVIVKNEKDDDECNQKTYEDANNAVEGFVLPSAEYSISDCNTLFDVKQLDNYLCNALQSSLTASSSDCSAQVIGTQFTIKHESDHFCEDYNQYNMDMHQQQNGDVSGNDTAHALEHDTAASSISDSTHVAESKHNIQKLTVHASPDFTSTFGTTTHADTTQKKSDSDNQPSDSNTEANQNIKISRCGVKVCDIFTNTLIVPKREDSPAETRDTNNICDSHDIDTISKEFIFLPSINEISASQSKPKRSKVSLNGIECSNERIIHLESDVNSVMNCSPANSLLVERKRFTCSICCKIYNRKSTLEKHIKKTHAELKQLNNNTATLKLLTCKFCQYKTKNKNHFTVHTRIHTGEKPFSCELCEYKCVSKSTLVVHMRTHTGEKPFTCKLCKYKCVKKSDLVQHIRIHTGEKPFSCELCEYKCVSNSRLVVHMRTHTGEKPFTCKLCKYKCVKKSDLVQHIRTHTGEKPYTCELCEHKFSRTSSLAKHKKTHTGEKPYSCVLCKHTFAYNSSLARHMKTHVGEIL